MAGEVGLWPLRAELSGEVLGEALLLRYGEGLALTFLGPHLQGEARYRGGLSGALAFHYPLPGGGLRGRVDLARGALDLEGEGAWEGKVEGSFCLPPPLGPCPGLRVGLEGGLAYGEVAFRGAYGYVAREGYLGEVAGEGGVSTPYGGLRLLGRGLGLDLLGEGLPLNGRLDLFPFRLAYRYQGPLPRGLGELSAEGLYPGAWLSGRYRLGEVELGLMGLPGFRVAVEGEGLRGEVGPEGVFLAFSGFRYGPLALTGKARGPWSGVALEGVLSAWGREARATGVWGREGLRLAFFGDLEGEVAWREAWEGRLAFPGGVLALSGRGLPQVEGEVLGERVRLSWPLLQVGGLRVDLLRREAEGEARLLGSLGVLGEGEALRLAYRVPGVGLPLEGRLGLRDLALDLTSPKGEGGLRYRGGRVEGRLALDLGGFALVLLGEGDRVGLLGSTPPTPGGRRGRGGSRERWGLRGPTASATGRAPRPWSWRGGSWRPPCGRRGLTWRGFSATLPPGTCAWTFPFPPWKAASRAG